MSVTNSFQLGGNFENYFIMTKKCMKLRNSNQLSYSIMACLPSRAAWTGSNSSSTAAGKPLISSCAKWKRGERFMKWHVVILTYFLLNETVLALLLGDLICMVRIPLEYVVCSLDQKTKSTFLRVLLTHYFSLATIVTTF